MTFTVENIGPKILAISVIFTKLPKVKKRTTIFSRKFAQSGHPGWVPEHLIMYIYEAPTSTAGRYNYFPNRVTR
jgi:hypothetical protein